MPGVDEAVEQLERLYRSVTGKPVPSGTTYAAIPPEKDAARHVQEQLDRLLQLLAGPVQTLAQLATWSPRVALWEGPRELLIQYELAGIPRDNVSVSVSSDILTVSGTRPLPASSERPVLRASELPVGPFVRALALPAGASSSDITSRLRDGILEVHVRRAPSPESPHVSGQPRPIAVG